MKAPRAGCADPPPPTWRWFPPRDVTNGSSRPQMAHAQPAAPQLAAQGRRVPSRPPSLRVPVPAAERRGWRRWGGSLGSWSVRPARAPRRRGAWRLRHTRAAEVTALCRANARPGPAGGEALPLTGAALAGPGRRQLREPPLLPVENGEGDARCGEGHGVIPH